MCGIAGMFGLKADPFVLENMLATMHRRGPDGRGICREGELTLLHARLAIIDPEGGRQPMELSWAGETFVLVYNGELYNTEELRRELLALGHSFLGHSDTEVVLHAYAQWGEVCLDRFNGIFAFAVWERNRRRLFLARDRIGVKPLFYWEREGSLIFASEIKTILAHPSVKPRLDREGAAQLILLGPGRLPGSGVFKNIREIEPGCCGFLEAGKLTLRRYWKLLDREHTDTFEETVEKVRFLVQDAIRRQMVSDVPIGTFLSGGLDSSIITAVCARELDCRGETLSTFSVDYENNEKFFVANKFQPNSDGAYIRLMQEQLNTDHHWTVLTPEQLSAVLEEATIARDLPGMADVDFSLLAFCGEIRREVKVALSGECADEIFGGYPWYRDPEIRAKAGFPWAQNTRQRAEILLPKLSRDPQEFVMDAYTQTCRESDILPGNSDVERRTKEMVNLNFRWFMQTLLDRKDRMSMYHSLEVRVPFCDYRIAEYLYGVPWEYKDWQGKEKGLLRKAVEGLLPEQVLYRKKSPYPKTFDPRYEQLMAARLEKLLDAGDSPLFAIVSRDGLRELLSQDSQWPWYGQLMRRPQTMAYFLQLDFWLRHYGVELLF
ncbi:MAG: asparagine synthase (glutamine-hydrolyzing) [Oscillospiraceae bacterium]|nr:asparagine synthase (glutamine-hydrolyzing) [Oscillospiraceae bacterium]